MNDDLINVLSELRYKPGSPERVAIAEYVMRALPVIREHMENVIGPDLPLPNGDEVLLMQVKQVNWTKAEQRQRLADLMD